MATILHNEAAWSTTPATNANVDTGINWAENQDAATVNDSARGMMAARAKARLDLGGALFSTGTANALVVTTNQVLSTPHLAAGTRLLVRASATNTTAAVTFAPDGLTPAPIKRGDGSALAVGDIQPGMPLDLIYNAASSEWRATNLAPAISPITGVTDGGDASAGRVGEYLTASGTSGAMITAVARNCGTLTLTAGDWDVWGWCNINPSVTMSNFAAGISLTINSLGLAYCQVAGGTFFASSPAPIMQRVNVTVGTNVYMTVYAQFASGTCAATGTLYARRVR